MAWTLDAPTGSYKDHALSTRIRMEAVADAMVLKFLTPEPGFGKRRGQSITVTRILQLPLANRVGELDSLPSGRPAIQSKAVTVSEWGFKIPMTEFEENLTYFDLSNPFQSMLRDQIALTMDKMAADALKQTKTKFIPALAGSVFDTDGTPSTLSDKNLDVSDLRLIHDELRRLKVPPFRGSKYIGILSTTAARGIKSDPEYKDWLAPTTSDPLLSGIIKDIEGFLLFESNHAASFDDTVGSSTTTGEALFFGADPGFLASIQTPELRASQPIPEELGRTRFLGWVGTVEAGLSWETAALSRVIHVTSS